MTKKNKVLLGIGAVCVLLCLSVLLMVFGGGVRDAEPTTTAAVSGEPMTYTVQVKNQGGLFLGNVGVYIYEDDTMQELVWFAKTDDNGKMTFTDTASDSYVAVLQDVPTGYAVEEMYLITGELTEIILSAAQMSEDDTEVTYKLGDMMMDFTVEDAEGDTYTLSKLLEQKKAVVLNFWYTTCGPCKAEFPYLQEAYEKYSDDIAVLAMNPVDTDEAAIAAFRKEMGLTFPMMACDPVWAQMMQLTAYPTTVVIDCYGNIMLIHKGSIDNAKTFEDVFAYFTAEDYKQKIIQDVNELVTEEEEGTKENPVEIGGVLNFEVTVKPGETVYTDVYKVKGMYMQIQGKDFKLLYNNKEYTPTNGTVGVVITTGDTYTPSNIGITNTGKETQTYKVAFSFIPGTLNNPYAMELGEFNVKVSAGNEQGVYYTYTAKEDGVLTLQCLEATAGVEYGYTLYNLDSYAQRTLALEGGLDENGVPTLSIQAHKGQTVQFIAATLPDENNNYPAANFKFLATFADGAIKEEEKKENLVYTVMVKDEAGKAIPGATVYLTSAEGKTTTLETNENGVAEAELLKGTYTALLKVPEGYTAEKTSFEMTAQAPALTISIKTKPAAVMVDYTVKAVDTFGAPVPGVTMMVDGYSSTLVTSKDGTAAVNLEKGSYKVYILGIPEGYTASKTEYAFEAESSVLMVTLGYKPGSEKNPITVEGKFPITTEEISPEKKVYYSVSGANGMVLTISDQNAYVIVDGVTYAAEEGAVSVTLPEGSERILLIIGNSGKEKEAYVVNLAYPLGSEKNPVKIINSFPIVTDEILPGETVYYEVYGAGEMAVSLNNANAYVTCEGVTYRADANGLVTLQISKRELSAPVLLGIGNGNKAAGAAAESYTLEFAYLPGHKNNPEILMNQEPFTVNLEEGDEDGHYYYLTAQEDGTLRFFVDEDPGVEYDVVVTKVDTGDSAALSESGEGKLSVEVAQGDLLLIHVFTKADAEEEYPAAEIQVKVSTGAEEEDPEEDPVTPPGSGETTEVSITTQPVSCEAYVDAVATFTVIAEGEELSYQWQYKAPDDTVWTDCGSEITGYNTNVLKPVMTETGNKYRYRCVITDGKDNTVISNEVVLSIKANAALTIVTQPENCAVEIGEAAVFTVEATGDRIKYQWQYRAAGTTAWTNCDDTVAGYNTAILKPVLTETIEGQEYRCVITDVSGRVITTKTVVLALKDIELKILQQPEDCTVEAGAAAKFVVTAEGRDLVYLWQYKSASDSTWKNCTSEMAGYNHHTLEIVIAESLDGMQYRCMITDRGENMVISEPATLTLKQPEKPEEPTGTTYKVTVTNETGVALEGSIYVAFYDAGVSLKGTEMINSASAGGTVERVMEPGNYTVKLTFTAAGNQKYTPGVLTEEIHSITMPLALGLSQDSELTDYTETTNGMLVYDVSLGSTYLQLDQYQKTYAVIDGVDYCFFRYMITEPGYYSFTTTNGAVVTGWGFTPGIYLNKGISSEGKENNTFYLNLTDQTINENNPEAPYIIGIEVTEEITETILMIGRREPQLTVDLAPWTPYEPIVTPPEIALEEKQVGGTTQSRYVPKGQVYQLSVPAGQTLKYVNMKTDQIVKGADGKYHLNSETGPEIYVYLGYEGSTTTRYGISFYNMLGLGGVGGTQFGRIYYNEDGTPKTTTDENGDLVYYKESYVDAMMAYTLHADPTHGVYPLNDDLKYMIQYGGENKGWYTQTSPNYLFGRQTITPEIGWKFVCCYVG